MNDVPSIVVDKLVKRFGDFTAVNQVSFQIRSGEIFGLLGPNHPHAVRPADSQLRVRHGGRT